MVNTKINIKELKKYRDECYQIMEKHTSRMTKEEQKWHDILFDRIFSTGMFAGINIIYSNPLFQEKEP